MHKQVGNSADWETPILSIVIPTLNSAGTLRNCLAAIHAQAFDQKRIELVIADAGSSDGTQEIAREYGATVVENPLKTGEAGKSAGIAASSGDLIALVDSDNILDDARWLEKMIRPFDDPEIVAAEPLFYTRRDTDPALTRYFAMLGMNDPLCLFLGNYDRFSLVTGKWTELGIRAVRCGPDAGDALKPGGDGAPPSKSGHNSWRALRRQRREGEGNALGDAPVSPHPNPLPEGEGEECASGSLSLGERVGVRGCRTFLTWIFRRSATGDAAEPDLESSMCVPASRSQESPPAGEFDYLKLTLEKAALPTIGANGFVFRRSLLEIVNWSPYFFDIDVLAEAIDAGHRHVAKVRCGIVHLYCSNLGDFYRKQDRRIRDFLHFSQERERSYPWQQQRRGGILKFCIYTLLVVPLIVQMVRGASRQRDWAWLYHIPVCWITLWVYGVNVVAKALGIRRGPKSRDAWQK